MYCMIYIKIEHHQSIRYYFEMLTGNKTGLPGFGYIAVNLDNTTLNCTGYIKSPTKVNQYLLNNT